MFPEPVAYQDGAAGRQVRAGRGERGQQTTEGVRGPDTEHQVERVRGDEVRGRCVVEDEALPDAAAIGRLSRLRQRVLGDVHAYGVQLRAGGQGAQHPFRAAAAEVEQPLVAAWRAAFQQPAHGFVVERSLDRVPGVGDAGHLFAIHRRSLAASPVARIRLSPWATLHTRFRSLLMWA